jgi:cob(I)alamin adenosyltransferase
MSSYTKRGDDGTCSLIGGDRVSKCSLRIAAVGELDELCAFIELAALEMNKDWNKRLLELESTLYKAGHDLALPAGNNDYYLGESDLTILECAIEPLEQGERINSFIKLGGTRGSAMLNLCRVVARRAERAVCNLASQEELNPVCLPYFNRLSSYFYVLCRYIGGKSQKEI